MSLSRSVTSISVVGYSRRSVLATHGAHAVAGIFLVACSPGANRAASAPSAGAPTTAAPALPAPSASAPAHAPSTAPDGPCPQGMILVPAATFMMGSKDKDLPDRHYWFDPRRDPDEEDWHGLDEPVHPVNIEAFCIDTTEVTVAAYRACVATNACEKIESDHRFCRWSDPGMEDRPMTCVNLAQANAYCRWARGRLPTEEEWEYAARGTDGRRYTWGDDDPEDGDFCNPRSDDFPCAVGTHPRDRSPFGVMDMVGNATEWTSTMVTDEHDRKPSPIVRGTASLHLGALRSASRRESSVDAAEFDYGLRCAAPSRTLLRHRQ